MPQVFAETVHENFGALDGGLMDVDGSLGKMFGHSHSLMAVRNWSLIPVQLGKRDIFQ